MTQDTPTGPDTEPVASADVAFNAPAQELAAGTILSGMYKIRDRIASGGFGITYRGEDNLGRAVAIKESYPLGCAMRDASGRVGPASASVAPIMIKAKELFLREAQTLATLNHPGIVHVQSLFEANGTAYMAMDYVPGQDLHDLVKDGLASSDLMAFLPPVLDALDYIHTKDILHRDLKPNNFRITPQGKPVLIDFGAARQQMLRDPDMSRASNFRVVADRYSPAEFYVSAAETGPQSDLYSLAATWYFALRGTAPAAADSRMQSVAMGDPDPFEPISGTIEGVDASILALIDDALTLRLANRPPNVAVWRARLELPQQNTRKSGNEDPGPHENANDGGAQDTQIYKGSRQTTSPKARPSGLHVAKPNPVKTEPLPEENTYREGANDRGANKFLRELSWMLAGVGVIGGLAAIFGLLG